MMKSTFACVFALAIAASAGCKKNEENKSTDDKVPTEDPSEKQAPDPEPAKQSITDLADSLWAAIAAHDEEKLAALYAADATFVAVDHEPTIGDKPKDAVGFANATWTSFPEISFERQLSLVNGDKLVTVVIAKGLDEGGVMEQEASGKPYTAAQATLLEGSGGKLKRHLTWIDQATMLSQLGLHPSESAPKAEPAWPSATLEPVTATNGPEEQKNVELVTAHVARLGSGKGAKNINLDYAAQGSFRYVPEAKAAVGLKAVTARIAEYLAPNAQLKVEVVEIWPAGSWVVARTRTQATIAKGIKGAEVLGGKKWQGEYLELYEMADGKIKTEYIFANNLRFEIDLGLFSPSEMDEGAEPAGD